MNAYAQLDASTLRSLPGEQLLVYRVLLGRKVARLIDAELDRRATAATFPGAMIETPVARSGRAARRKHAA
ncbi:MAG: hypothetical protein AB7G11_10245 [Phycisphaerales bacterium]